jgi:hypothetical protein
MDDIKEKISLSDFSGGAKDTMNQLFLFSPVWDGDIASKVGRDEICNLGFAEHRNGWTYLTRSGVEFAIAADVSNWADKRWHRKQQGL